MERLLITTLIGEKTGGDGIGSDPLLAVLPHSGYVFRFTKEMGTTGDGTCNEEHKTMPDYVIENPLRVGYSLTEEGKMLMKALEHVSDWAQNRIDKNK